MKRLLLLRHAKSSRDDPALGDFERPLNGRGRDAAPRMGAVLSREGWVPDVVLCSAARRTVETWELISPLLGDVSDVRMDHDLYLADVPVLLQKVRGLPDAAGSALLIGHNPGVEELARSLAGYGDAKGLRRMRSRYPTAALAVIDVELARWAAVGAGRGRLESFVRPKDVA